MDTVRRVSHLRAGKYRDSECAKCGSVDRLEVHHIDRNWLNNETGNLQTLCRTCHMILHALSGDLVGAPRRFTAEQQHAKKMEWAKEIKRETESVKFMSKKTKPKPQPKLPQYPNVK